MKPSENPKNKVQRASRCMNTERFREDMEILNPFCIITLCISFTWLFLSVSLYPTDYANCLAVSHCSLIPGKTRHGQGSWKNM